MGDQNVLFSVEYKRSSSTWADISRGIHFEPVRCKTFYAKSQPFPVRCAVGIIETNAQFSIPKRGDCMQPKKLSLRILQFSASHLDFGLDHSAVIRGDIPRFAVIGQPFI